MTPDPYHTPGFVNACETLVTTLINANSFCSGMLATYRNSSIELEARLVVTRTSFSVTTRLGSLPDQC